MSPTTSNPTVFAAGPTLMFVVGMVGGTERYGTLPLPACTDRDRRSDRAAFETRKGDRPSCATPFLMECLERTCVLCCANFNFVFDRRNSGCRPCRLLGGLSFDPRFHRATQDNF